MKRLVSASVFLLGILTADVCFAGISVQLNINPQKVAQGQRFVVTVEVRSTETNGSGRPKPPIINGAQLSNQWSGQRMNAATVTNADGDLEFKTTRTQTFSFEYVAIKKGQLKIPVIEVPTGATVYKTAASTVTVLDASAAQQKSPQNARARRRANDPFKSMQNFNQQFNKQIEEQFNQLMKRGFGRGGLSGFQAVPPNIAKSSFFIVAEVDKTEAYEGEQIRASWYLYTLGRVREIDTLKYPDLKGFWKEDIELATLLRFKPVEFEGQVYQRALLASYALFPIDSGQSTIDQYKAKVGINDSYGQNVLETKSSEPIPILIKQLPTDGMPENYTGAVGDYEVTARVDSNSVPRTGEPYLVRIRIEGNGNAKNFEMPELNLPEGTEIYDTKSDAKFFKSGKSYKEFEVYLLTQSEGLVEIPPIRIDFFNTETETYESSETAKVAVRVLKGKVTESFESSRLQSKKELKKLEFIPSPNTESRDPRPLWWLWVLLNVVTVGCLFTYATILLGWWAKPKTFIETYKEREAEIYRLIKNQQWREVGSQSVNLVYHVMDEVTGEESSGRDLIRLLDKSSPSVRRVVGDELVSVFSTFNSLGFGPDEQLKDTLSKKQPKEEFKKLAKLLATSMELAALNTDTM